MALSPSTPFVVTADMVRMFMRDYAASAGVLTDGQGNLLIDDVQFKEDELLNAIDMAVSAYNGITPMSYYTRENFPNEYLLLIGTTRFLMMSESFHQLRNQVGVQDGDVMPAGIYEKYQLYMNMANALRAEWQEIARNIKNQVNMESAYGVVGSGYSYVGRRGRYL
jgi:hypothetical protein